MKTRLGELSKLEKKLEQNDACVGIIGLGYVGLPLAQAFSESLKVIGFDTDARRINKLRDRQLRYSTGTDNLAFTTDPGQIAEADFNIICVPTPVTRSKEPDLSYVKSAAEIVGQNMRPGCVVVLESTVYPGVTEEIVKPALEDKSGLVCGKDFKIAYSPERINPGDEEHALNKVTKVVAGMDKETTGLVAALYRKAVPQVFIARDIKTAEAAKVIENIQRDLNIALVNELAIIFEKMGLNITEVLDAAATKWNFHRYSPGMVGGHCIPVDPYYLVSKAEELGYHPQVILAGRAINDYMPKYVAEIAIKALNSVGKVIKGSKVIIMGLTYKGNVADIRETPAKEMIKELKEYQVEVFGFDPLLDAENMEDEFGIRILHNMKEIGELKADGIIFTVAHAAFQELHLIALKAMLGSSPVLVDVRNIFDAKEAQKLGFHYRSL